MLLGLLLNREFRLPLTHVVWSFIVCLVAFFLVSKVLYIPFSQAVEGGIQRVPITLLPSKTYNVDPSVRTRIFESGMALRIWADHVIFGAGLNKIQFVGVQYIPIYAPLWQKKHAMRCYTYNM